MVLRMLRWAGRYSSRRRSAGWLCALIVVLGAWLVVPANEAFAAATSGRSASGTTTIVVKISGLPPGVPASVVVHGPRLSAVLSGSRRLLHLHPGRYTFTIHRVIIRGRRGHVRAGSIALPAIHQESVLVGAGHRTVVHLEYGTIINSNVRTLSSRPLAVKGSPANPKAIVVPLALHLAAGEILTAKPSATLPAGLFDKVTSTKRAGRRVTLKLVPAQLTEAFPQLDINSNVSFSPGQTSVGEAQAAAFQPLVASLGIDNFRCQLPLADSQLSAQQDFGINADVQLHVPTFFGVPVGLPEGRIALTLKASASLQAFIRRNTGCSAVVNFPPLPGEIPVGPVVVPVYLQFGLFGSATIGADLTANASAGFSLTAGMEFHGTSIHNISGATVSAHASATGEGKLSIGPSLRFAVGVAGVADVHLDAKPSLAFLAGLDGSCSLDLVAGSQVGISLGPFQLNENLPAPTATLYRCPSKPAAAAKLVVRETGPPGAFPGQPFEYTTSVTNTGSTAATGVDIVDTLPSEGAYVSSAPSGTPASPAPSGAYSIPLGNLAPGETKTASLRWTAPLSPTTLVNSAVADASNAETAGPAAASVSVGSLGNCNPCGAVSAGTGLRSRNRGTISINGIPPGATVERAVLIWGILYENEVPRNTITFDDHQLSANLTSNVSGTLCWGDSATVGYAADVTPYVTGNGTYEVTEPPNGEVRVDENPYGPLPYSDGASLIVFYDGGGADNQVLSEFSYNTNTDPTTENSITRSFTGINSVGGPASLTLAGPDGQNNAGKVFAFTGSTELVVENPFEGRAPQEGPSFPIGNLWDDEEFNVSAILPAGQQTFTFNTIKTEDCIGVGAAVLQVAQ